MPFRTSHVLLLLLGLSERMVTLVTADCIADKYVIFHLRFFAQHLALAPTVGGPDSPIHT